MTPDSLARVRRGASARPVGAGVAAGVIAGLLLLPACADGSPRGSDPSSADLPSADLPSAGAPTARAPTARLPSADPSVPATAAQQPGPATERLTGSGDHVLVRRVDVAAATLTVNVVQFLTGAAARRACKQDRVPGHAGGLCDNFYLRDTRPDVNTEPVHPDAVITILSGRRAGARRSTMAEVNARLTEHA